jgi:hypothetical protein
MRRLRRSVKDATAGLTGLGDKVARTAEEASSSTTAAGGGAGGDRRGSLIGRSGSAGGGGSGGGGGVDVSSARGVIAAILAPAVTGMDGDGGSGGRRKGKGSGASPADAKSVAQRVMVQLRGPVVEALGISGGDGDGAAPGTGDDDDDDDDASDSGSDSDDDAERREREEAIERERKMSPWRRSVQTGVLGFKQQVQGFFGNGVWVMAHVFVMGLPTFILFWAAVSLRVKVLEDLTACTSYDQPVRAISLLAWAYFVVGLGELALHWALLPRSLRPARILYQRFFYVLLGLYTFVVFFFLSLVICWMILGLLIKPEEAIAYVMGLVSVFGMIGAQAKRAKALVERLTEAMHSEITAQLRRIRVTVTRQERSLFVKNALMGLRLTGANIATAIFALLVAMSIVLAFVYLGMSVFSEPGTTQALFGSALSSLAGIAAIAKGRTTPEEQKKFDDRAVALVRTSIRAALEKLIAAMQHLHAHVVEPITTRARRIAAAAQAKAQAQLDALDREAKRALRKGTTFINDKTREARDRALTLIDKSSDLIATLSEQAVAHAQSTLNKGESLVAERVDVASRAAREALRKGDDYISESIVSAEGAARAELDDAAELKRDIAEGGSVAAALRESHAESARLASEDAKYTLIARAVTISDAAREAKSATAAAAAAKSAGGGGKSKKKTAAGGEQANDLIKCAVHDAHREAAFPLALQAVYEAEAVGLARARAERIVRDVTPSSGRRGAGGNDPLAEHRTAVRADAELAAAESSAMAMLPQFVRVSAAVGRAEAEIEARYIAYEGANGDLNVDEDKIALDDLKTYRSKAYLHRSQDAIKTRREKVARLLAKIPRPSAGTPGDGAESAPERVRTALLDLLTAASAWASAPVGIVEGSVEVSVRGGSNTSDADVDPSAAAAKRKISIPAGYEGALVGELLKIRRDLYITPTERKKIFDPPGKDNKEPQAIGKALRTSLDSIGNERLARMRASKGAFLSSERKAWETAATRLHADRAAITTIAMARADLHVSLLGAIIEAFPQESAPSLTQGPRQFGPGGLLYVDLVASGIEIAVRDVGLRGTAYRDALVARAIATTRAEIETAATMVGTTGSAAGGVAILGNPIGFFVFVFVFCKKKKKKVRGFVCSKF